MYHFTFGILGRDNIKIKSVHDMVRQKEGFDSAPRRFHVPCGGTQKIADSDSGCASAVGRSSGPETESYKVALDEKGKHGCGSQTPEGTSAPERAEARLVSWGALRVD